MRQERECCALSLPTADLCGLFAASAYIKCDSADKDDALDNILIGNADTDQVQAVGQRHDDKRTDHGADDAADTACRGDTCNIARGDGVKFKPLPAVGVAAPRREV